MAAFAATPARFAFFSPRRFPMLKKCQTRPWDTGTAANRTEAAMPKAYGAWKVHEIVDSSTDCDANVMGPRLQRFTPLRVRAAGVTITYKLAATRCIGMNTSGRVRRDMPRTSNELPGPPFRCHLTCARVLAKQYRQDRYLLTNATHAQPCQ